MLSYPWKVETVWSFLPEWPEKMKEVRALPKIWDYLITDKDGLIIREFFTCNLNSCVCVKTCQSGLNAKRVCLWHIIYTEAFDNDLWKDVRSNYKIRFVYLSKVHEEKCSQCIVNSQWVLLGTGLSVWGLMVHGGGGNSGNRILEILFQYSIQKGG